MKQSAKEIVQWQYPQAEVTRSTFGLVVVTDDTHAKKLGDGRAYWEEEAWISAAEALEERVAAGCGTKPCPFCGSNKLSSEHGYVLCTECQTTGPDVELDVSRFAGMSRFDAWNQRAEVK